MRILQIARVNGMGPYECHNLGEIQANKRYRIDSGTFRSLMHVTLRDHKPFSNPNGEILKCHTLNIPFPRLMPEIVTLSSAFP